jgi:hypothetical protein
MGGDLAYNYDNGTSIFEVTLPVANKPTNPDQLIIGRSEDAMLAGSEP